MLLRATSYTTPARHKQDDRVKGALSVSEIKQLFSVLPKWDISLWEFRAALNKMETAKLHYKAPSAVDKKLHAVGKSMHTGAEKWRKARSVSEEEVSLRVACKRAGIAYCATVGIAYCTTVARGACVCVGRGTVRWGWGANVGRYNTEMVVRWGWGASVRRYQKRDGGTVGVGCERGALTKRWRAAWRYARSPAVDDIPPWQLDDPPCFSAPEYRIHNRRCASSACSTSTTTVRSRRRKS